VNRSLEQAAESICYYERAHIFRNPAKFRLADPELVAFYASQGATVSVRSFRLNDVVLDAGGAILFQNDSEIEDTRYLVVDDYRAPPDPKALIRLSEDFEYVLGYNRGHTGYHHWVMQCLPAIDWGMRQQRTKPVRLVLPRLAPWQEEMIALLGYAQVPRITVEEGKFYACPQLIYGEYLNGKTAFSVVTTVYDTARRMLARVPATNAHNPILFVPCSSSYYGVITNEVEVIDLFRRFGAVIVSRDLKADVRINLFRNAAVVVGPFGEGLADILFCRPATLLWEWTPRHHQNAAINRLAQVAQVDYWGDVFESEPGSHFPRRWSIDLQLVRRRLSEISERLARRASGNDRLVPYVAVRQRKPLDELMLAFESLGENCDFGLMQRCAGVEPLGIYRFSGTSLDQLLSALDNKFEGVGDPENFSLVLAGRAPNREFMVAELTIGGYHTFICEGEMEPDELRTRQAKHLKFLRRKILEDLRTAEKIWVWKEAVPSDPDRIFTLLRTLQRFGPNKLFWATVGDETPRPGTVEQLGPDLIRGYVKPRPEEGSSEPFPSTPWFEACENAYRIWYPDEVEPDPAEAQCQPAIPLSAMDILRRGPVEATQGAEPRPPISNPGWFAKIWSRLSSHS
jgi:capsular polysaccharide biosynthesis protein